MPGREPLEQARLREEEEDDVDVLDDEFSSCWILCRGGLKKKKKRERRRMEEWKSGPLKTKVGSIGRSIWITTPSCRGVRLMYHSREDGISGWHERVSSAAKSRKQK